MDPGPFFYIWNTSYCNHCSLLFFANKPHFPHHTFNPLFTASRWDWQPHYYIGAKYFDCVVQVPRWRQNPWCCAALHSFTNNLHVVFISYWFDNLGFLLRENSLLYSSYLPLGVPNGRVLYRHKQLFFWRRCREDQDTLQGESLTPNLFTLFIVLLCFIFCFVCFTSFTLFNSGCLVYFYYC